MNALVRAASLTRFAEVARAAGLDPTRQILDAGLDPSMLRDPDVMIPAVRVRRLLELSARRSGVESFGLRMAQSRPLSNLGPVGMLVRDQPTLRESLQVLVRWHTAMNGALSLVIEEQGDIAVIREDLLTAGSDSVRQSTELAVGVLVEAMRAILGADWQPRQVCFTHDAPVDMAMHHQFFGRRVLFGQDFNGVVCTVRDLETPNASADPLMARYAQQLLDASPMAATASTDTTLADVRRTVLLLLPSGRCGIDQVASHLGLVSRTVQRRLAEHGQSFSGLVNEIRVELAHRHTTRGARPLTDIASLLGFSALSGFSRWYQQQFGCSPSQARLQAQGKASPPTADLAGGLGEPAAGRFDEPVASSEDGQQHEHQARQEDGLSDHQ